VEKKIIFFVQV